MYISLSLTKELRSKQEEITTTERGVLIMELSKEAKQKRLEYMRKWREKNKEKSLQHTKDFWERQAAKEQKETTS